METAFARARTLGFPPGGGFGYNSSGENQSRILDAASKPALGYFAGRWDG